MSARRPKARLTLQQHQDALNYAFTGYSRPNDHLDQSDVYMVFCALIDSAEMVSYLRDRIAELEAERDAAKAGEENLKRKWQIEECAHCGERPGGHQGTIWCAECFEWWVRESEQECITQLRTDLDATRAGEARAVEALRKIAQNATTEVQGVNGVPGTEAMLCCLCGQVDGHNDGCPALAFGELDSQPALDWLAQREREAAVAELRGLWSGWVQNDLYRSGVGEVWRYIRDRAAALATQQPTACFREEK
jgi:hypothetical protein